MCGIMGVVGSQHAWPVIVAGLKRLEYRGYDSAGIATWFDNKVHLARAVGPLHRLEARFPEGLGGTVGVGHTRWATHGVVSLENCHPHQDRQQTLAIAHNGIIDNAEHLRAQLGLDGFRSQTDTEVLAELIASVYNGDLLQAVRQAMNQIQGTAAVVVVHQDHPDQLVVARLGSPVVVGLGEQVSFVASDAQALSPLTERIIVLQDSDVALLTPGYVEIIDLDNRARERRVEALTHLPEAQELGEYPHYFLKEAHEQPEVLSRAMLGRLDTSRKTARLDELDVLPQRPSRVCFFGCGSSKLAGDVGRYLVERYAGVMSLSEDAAELASLHPVVDPETLYVGLSQSGETADVLALMKELELRQAQMITITNVVGNSMARCALANVYMHAGAEFSVASTKSMSAQMMVASLMALRWARQRGMTPQDGQRWLQGLVEAPRLAAEMLTHHARIAELAQRHKHARYVMFIGRGISLPIAHEGALKLKELSYIPSEGLSGAQMKHGPIALIEEGSPVWVIAPPDHTRERMVANIQELRARGAEILAVAAHDDEAIAQLADVHIPLPDHHPAISPLLSVVPLQLFAYEVARVLGREVDRPRNLAKSVTVE